MKDEDRKSAAAPVLERIFMIFRPAPYCNSRRGSSSSHLSRLPVIVVLLAAFCCWSSSRRLTAAFSFSLRVLPSASSTAAIYASIRHQTSASAPATPSRRSTIAVQAVGSSNNDNTITTMTSPPTLSSSAITVPGIATQTLSNLVEYATSFGAAHGLQVELRDSSSSSPTNNNIDNNTHNRGYITAPISLLPQAYPSLQFRMATLLAAPFNILVDRISNDATFLQETLSDVRNVDEYTGKLLDLYEEIYCGK